MDRSHLSIIISRPVDITLVQFFENTHPTTCAFGSVICAQYTVHLHTAHCILCVQYTVHLHTAYCIILCVEYTMHWRRGQFEARARLHQLGTGSQLAPAEWGGGGGGEDGDGAVTTTTYGYVYSSSI